MKVQSDCSDRKLETISASTIREQQPQGESDATLVQCYLSLLAQFVWSFLQGKRQWIDFLPNLLSLSLSTDQEVLLHHDYQKEGEDICTSPKRVLFVDRDREWNSKQGFEYQSMGVAACLPSQWAHC